MAQPPNPRAAAVTQRVAVYNQRNPGRSIDPRAALAVAAQEGLSGGIGDGGHAFGDFQLNDAGGVLTGKFPGLSAQQKQQWASSPAGIDFALGGIGKVSGGMRGADAVKAIVSQFERPANIPRETQSALAAYGIQPQVAARSLAAAAVGKGGGPAPVVQPSPDFRAQLAHELASAAGSQGNNLTGFYSTLHQALQARATAAQQPAPTRTALPHPSGLAGDRQASTIPVGATGIAKTALTQLGTPYQWGGKAALGSRTDCSGLLQASARANGVSIGRTTYQQFKQGSPVALNQLQPGDAVFSEQTAQGPGHVAIYIGGGKVVEDPHTGAVVSISDLHGRKGIVGARRYG